MASADFRTNPENFCYRHPDRQSFVLCQRCLRTICPECQTQMPVGVICPECLRDQQQAAKVTRMPRRRGSVRARAADSRPLVTYAIVIVTSLTYLVTLIPGIGNIVQGYLAFNSAFLFPGIGFQPWRLLTVTLVHASLWHVALNMLALWALGRSLEPLLGRVRFLALYLLSALGGSVLVSLLAPGTWVVGASGAVWGLLGAMFVIGRHLGVNVTAIAVLLGLNLVITFLPGSNISWQAHIGGGLVGALVAYIFARTRARAQQRTQMWLLIGVAVGLLALLVVPVLVYG
ncbi:rhomboid family intramembrane serine protease [Microbacterium sp. zg.Y1090]|uniref:rhomboid family intramembrane serine protease n=1 Tax=Microbacterium TaxID=33882 RepID=UPI00214BF7C3|nr:MULTISPECIES: rhomboid family intramembrane serine protease [unclassified Microbacterium]MCR2813017.1 rhomboid family intramembrane serine protease [Microbacterium sp. zg.Y1084]MCR2819350.1 rhomboid family intramembrane serine protease [Microbacterium sp. zg.Y1090]MDL5487267.1 rhomboid family intramembrane serine protease [Microbacterium sp. zg-Y1211]WIM28331.1 rhomboid family intramembrane serine protease [Microbacterium sp. zg-Y1090]